MNIHRWFIPSKKNKFHPHALRPVGLVVFLLLFIAIPPLYNVVAAKQMQVLGYATNITLSDVLAQTNQQRVAAGLPAFTLDSQLNSAAYAKANDMFAKNYWAHVAPDGTTPWYFITSAGYSYQSAGENLAKDFNTSSGVVSGWMGSATHKANILSSTYTDVGIAVVDGTLLGSQTTLVVAMYGLRNAPASTPAPIQTAAPVQSTPTPLPEEVPPPAPVEAHTPEPTEEAQETIDNPTTSKEEVVKGGQQPAEQGQVEGLSTFLPVKIYNGMNWGQKASLVLLGFLGLLFIMKHTTVWRAQKRGARHIWLRAHPFSQFVMLSAVAIITILSGVGTIL